MIKTKFHTLWFSGVFANKTFALTPIVRIPVKTSSHGGYYAWVMHKYALCLFTSGGALFNQANIRCIAHAGYFDKLQDNKHLREKTTVLREKTTAFSLKWLYQFS